MMVVADVPRKMMVNVKRIALISLEAMILWQGAIFARSFVFPAPERLLENIAMISRRESMNKQLELTPSEVQYLIDLLGSYSSMLINTIGDFIPDCHADIQDKLKELK
jgi:hypothetical protein